MVSILNTDFLDINLLPMIEPVSSDFTVLSIRRVLLCLLSIFMWEFIYQIFRRAYKLDITQASNRTALFHAFHECFAVTFVFLIYYDDVFIIPSKSNWCDPIPKAEYIFAITCGYFLWDLTWLARHFDALWLLHASMSLGVYFPAMMVPYFQKQSLTVLYYEIPTIFYHSYMILEKAGYSNQLVKILKLLFFITFFIFRIILGSFVVFEVWDSSWFNIYYKHHINCVPFLCYGPISLLVAAFQCLNFYWFICILMQANKNKKD